MSKWGIKKFASVLSDMQEARLDLLNEGKDTQDIRLGQLLDVAKDAVKHQFCKITVEKKLNRITKALKKVCKPRMMAGLGVERRKIKVSWSDLEVAGTGSHRPSSVLSKVGGRPKRL